MSDGGQGDTHPKNLKHAFELVQKESQLDYNNVLSVMRFV